MKILVSAIIALLAAPAVGVLLAAEPAAPDVRLVQAQAAFESARAECLSTGEDCWKALTLGSIASAQAKSGDAVVSRQTLIQAFQAAQNIKDETQKAVALGSIAGSHETIPPSHARFAEPVAALAALTPKPQNPMLLTRGIPIRE